MAHPPSKILLSRPDRTDKIQSSDQIQLISTGDSAILFSFTCQKVGVEEHIGGKALRPVDA